MTDPIYPRLRIRADANWRAVVRAAACQFDRRIRHDPAFRTGQQADFLDIEPDASYDRIVMNPPFAGQDDIRHVMHAFGFLRRNGRLVAIMSAGILFRANKLTTAFRDFVADRGGAIEPLPEGSFRSSGTAVNTCVVTITARGGHA